MLSVPEFANCPYELASGTMKDCALEGSFRFGSARHLGEDPSGTWTLRMADRRSGGSPNRLASWSITVYGHKSTPEAPALEHVKPGMDFLTVAWTWTDLDYRGTSNVTGFDVRHISSDSTSKANDSAWTLITPAGAATTRSYTIAMLDDGARRDVQVRAVNDSGGGDWSVTGRGTPGAANSEPFTGASSRSYTPVDAPPDSDVDRYLRVTASYSDRHGAGKTVTAVSGDTVRAAPPTNEDPEFPASENGMRPRR